MSATATAPSKAAATASDVLLALGDAEMPLAELIRQTSHAAVAAAWARGDVEFGRRSRVVTGNPNIRITREGESPARLVVEDGVEWSGPKTSRHGALAAVIAGNAVPACDHYRKYVRATNDQGETYMKPVAIERAEAVELCALAVKLTDKGLAALTPDAA